MLMCCMRHMADPLMIETLKEKLEALPPLMSERWRRYWAATEAKALGYGGSAAVTHATGLSRQTLARGLADRTAPQTLPSSSPPRSRRPPAIETAPTVRHALETLVDPTTRGAPMSPLGWTGKSPRKLAEALQPHGHRGGARTVAPLVPALDDSRPANRQSREGSAPPDRHAPFAYMNAHGRAFQERGQPVVSMEAKHKDLGGDCANKGQAWPPQGPPDEVGTDDCPAPHLGKGMP